MKHFKFLSALLLLAALPLCSRAQQMVSRPFLCIEKTNGSVVKVPITEKDTPLYSFGRDGDGNSGQFLAVEDNGKRIYILWSDVRRLTTKFEMVNAIELSQAEVEDALQSVYTVSGVRVGHPANLQGLPKGVYVVKKGNRTIKYVNR